MGSVTEQHKKSSEGPLTFVLITISTSRFDGYGHVSDPDDAMDTSGRVMIDLVEGDGHLVRMYILVDDDESHIRDAVMSGITAGADIIVTSGGTGLAPADVTIESLRPMFDKELTGFGELFRSISVDHIGSAVILTRAVAGIIGDHVVFCLPGSPGAVKTALTDIIIPEAGHIVKHVK